VSKKEAKEKKGKAPKGAPDAVPQEPGKKAKGPRGPQEPSRLRVRYSKEVVPALMKHFSYTNVMAVPKLEKIVINMGLGEAVANAKILDVAVGELGQIAGQRPVITRAKKSIANFKLRQNMPIGAAVTLRGERMFEFLDRLTNVVLPRITTSPLRKPTPLGIPGPECVTYRTVAGSRAGGGGAVTLRAGIYPVAESSACSNTSSPPRRSSSVARTAPVSRSGRDTGWSATDGPPATP